MAGKASLNPLAEEHVQSPEWDGGWCVLEWPGVHRTWSRGGERGWDVVKEVARAFYAMVRFLARTLNEVGAIRGLQAEGGTGSDLP